MSDDVLKINRICLNLLTPEAFGVVYYGSELDRYSEFIENILYRCSEAWILWMQDFKVAQTFCCLLFKETIISVTKLSKDSTFLQESVYKYITFFCNFNCRS